LFEVAKGLALLFLPHYFYNEFWVETSGVG
jgi:hypothetical protein